MIEITIYQHDKTAAEKDFIELIKQIMAIGKHETVTFYGRLYTPTGWCERKIRGVDSVIITLEPIGKVK